MKTHILLSFSALAMASVAVPALAFTSAELDAMAKQSQANMQRIVTKACSPIIPVDDEPMSGTTSDTSVSSSGTSKSNCVNSAMRQVSRRVYQLVWNGDISVTPVDPSTTRPPHMCDAEMGSSFRPKYCNPIGVVKPPVHRVPVYREPGNFEEPNAGGSPGVSPSGGSGASVGTTGRIWPND